MYDRFYENVKFLRREEASLSAGAGVAIETSLGAAKTCSFKLPLFGTEVIAWVLTGLKPGAVVDTGAATGAANDAANDAAKTGV